MVVDQYRIEKKGLNLNEAWVDGVAIKVGTSLVNQSWESSMMHSSSTSSSPTTVIMVPFMGNLRHQRYEDATTKLAWIQGRASNILYVYSISATWNRVDRTRGPTWRLSRTIPCAVRVVPSYARTAVVRIRRKGPNSTA